MPEITIWILIFPLGTLKRSQQFSSSLHLGENNYMKKDKINVI